MCYCGDPDCCCYCGKEGPPIFLEGVTTCVNNADFLAHTLPHNKHLFDRYIVVTAPEDKDTQRICRYWGVECLQTDTFRTRWDEFCKGACINEALAKLSLSDWVLHIDADILLPQQTRRVIQNAELDKSMIYGVDRLEFKSYERFQEFYGNPQLHTDGKYDCFINMSHVGDDVRIGTRVSFSHCGGYIPIGFFQLWNPKVSGGEQYADGHTDASREDNVFALRWPRAKRGFIPEILAYHLESQEAKMSVNWKGRVTKKFQIGK